MKTKKILYWSPRVLGILYVLFLSIFSLDVFSENYNFPEILLALFMHLLPSLVLTILLIIAWKKELIGAIVFFILGIIFTFFFDTYEDFFGFLIISFPILVLSLGFFLNYKLKKD